MSQRDNDRVLYNSSAVLFGTIVCGLFYYETAAYFSATTKIWELFEDKCIGGERTTVALASCR